MKKSNFSRLSSLPLMVMIIAFFFLALGLAFFYYTSNESEAVIKSVSQELGAISNLKVNQISEWHKSLSEDAELIYNDKPLVNSIKSIIFNSEKNIEELNAWILTLLTKKNYSRILILDQNSTIRFSFPDTSKFDNKCFILNKNRISISNLHIINSKPQLEVTIPLQNDEKDENLTGGFIVLIVDPVKELYPLIQKWPTNSYSAESLILTRDGDSVLFLNELRHRKNTAFKFKLSINEHPDVAAVRAIRGERGIFESLDYRGQKVIVSIQHINSLNWFIVTKIDQNEVYDPIRKNWINFAIVIFFLGSFSILLFVFLYRADKASSYKRELINELERRKLSLKYEQLAYAASDIIIVTDKNFLVLDANRQATELYQLESDEFKQKFITSLENNDLPEKNKIAFNLAQTPPVLFFESKHKKSDGSEFFVEVSAKTISIDSEEQILFIIRNITERKNFEELQRLSMQRMSLFVDQTPLGVIQWDLDFQVKEWNPAAEGIFGYSKDEAIGKYGNFILPVSMRSFGNEIWEALVNQKGGLKSTNSNITKSGNIIVCEWFNTPLKDMEGKTIGVNSLVQNVTERVRAEEALKISETQFRGIFENSITGISLHELILDEAGNPFDYRFINTNDAFEDLTGLVRNNILGKTVREVIPGIEFTEFINLYGKVTLTGEPLFFENYAEPLKKHYLINAFKYDELKFVTAFLDITEMKIKEAEIKQKNEELTKFIYTVSHDLRSPLVTIKSFLGFLDQDIKSEDQISINKDITYIRNASEKMGILLDELLELSRIGRKTNPQVEVYLKDIVNSALDLVAGMIKNKNIEIVVTNEPVMLFGDPQRLTELFQNLLDNAAKFIGDQPKPKIEIGAEIINNEITIFVKDNGIGIDNRYIKKLFGLFEKLDASTDGVGMGLAIVKRIIEIHNGEILVESEGPGKGAKFSFKLANTKLKIKLEN